MELIKSWKVVLKKAWSIRLMLIAGLLSAAEFLLPYYADSFPRGVFGLVSGVVIMAAFIARLIAQRGVDE